MSKKRLFQKAFTLAELLIVVIVLGILSAVAVPKFSRALETRRTTEAEDILSAVRTEQEYRCVQGKNYQMDWGNLQAVASAKDSKNYSYSLTATGAKATSAKGYSIAMPAYQNGQLCCEGDYCSSLNKNYPACAAVPTPEDACAGAPLSACKDPARMNTCHCPDYALAHLNECNYQERERCESAGRDGSVGTWDYDNLTCICPEGTRLSDQDVCEAPDPCELNPNSCSCGSYANRNPCECEPDGKSCCSKKGWYWSGTVCQDYCSLGWSKNTCKCASYAEKHAWPCVSQEECEHRRHQVFDSFEGCQDKCQEGYFWDQEGHACAKDSGLTWGLENCTAAACCDHCPQTEIGNACSGPCAVKGDSYTISGALYPGNACPDMETCQCVCS